MIRRNVRDSNPPLDASEPTDKEVVALPISGPQSADRAQQIKRRLSKLEGTLEIRVDYLTFTVHVEYDPARITPREIREQIEGIDQNDPADRPFHDEATSSNRKSLQTTATGASPAYRIAVWRVGADCEMGPSLSSLETFATESGKFASPPLSRNEEKTAAQERKRAVSRPSLSTYASIIDCWLPRSPFQNFIRERPS